jgi:hypothetical protein
MCRKFLNGKVAGILTVLLVLFTAIGVAEEERTDGSGQWKYVLEDGGATITGYSEKPSGDLVIPNEVDGNPVTGIGYRAFLACEGITSVTIPENVTRIGESAFGSCIALTGLTIPEGVTHIGVAAFGVCTSLISVTIPEGVTSIERSTFSTCTSLSSVTIPAGITDIGDSAFFDCNSLASVTIPNGVVSIGNNAFEKCNNLTSIIIPDSVTRIGSNAFEICVALTSVKIPDSVTSIGYGAFNKNNCTVLAVTEGSAGEQYAKVNGIRYVNGNPDNLVTKWSYEHAGDGVTLTRWEEKCPSGNIIVPAELDGYRVTGIGDRVFERCVGLISVSIPDDVTSIGENAFFGCRGLTSVSIPDNVTSIGDYAFYGCGSLTNVTIPASVTHLGTRVFEGCNILTQTVMEGSYAEQYAQENSIPYTLNTEMSAEALHEVDALYGEWKCIVETDGTEDCVFSLSFVEPNTVDFTAGWYQSEIASMYTGQFTITGDNVLRLEMTKIDTRDPLTGTFAFDLTNDALVLVKLSGDGLSYLFETGKPMGFVAVSSFNDAE